MQPVRKQRQDRTRPRPLAFAQLFLVSPPGALLTILPNPTQVPLFQSQVLNKRSLSLCSSLLSIPLSQGFPSPCVPMACYQLIHPRPRPVCDNCSFFSGVFFHLTRNPLEPACFYQTLWRKGEPQV